MRVTRRNFRCPLAAVLLATYACFSLLGEGLHFVVPGCGHHHRLFVCGHEHGGQAHGETHYAEDAPLAADHACDARECEVCAFLFQLHSPPSSVAPAIDWQPVCVAVVLSPPEHYASAALTPHPPRGPPIIIG